MVKGAVGGGGGCGGQQGVRGIGLLLWCVTSVHLIVKVTLNIV